MSNPSEKPARDEAFERAWAVMSVSTLPASYKQLRSLLRMAFESGWLACELHHDCKPKPETNDAQAEDST